MFKTMQAANKLKQTPHSARRWLMDQTLTFAAQKRDEQSKLAAEGDQEAAARVQVIDRAVAVLNTLDV